MHRSRTSAYIAGVAIAAMTLSVPASAQILTLVDLENQLLALDAVVTLQGAAITTLQADVTATAGSIATVNAQVNINTTQITNLQAAQTVTDGQVATNTAAIGTLQADVAGHTAQISAQGSAIAAVQTGLAANDARDDAQDTAIAGVQSGLAANNARDDSQDAAIAGMQSSVTANNTAVAGQNTAIAGVQTGLAANTVHDNAQDVRLDYQDVVLAQHDQKIGTALAVADNAMASATQLRQDVDSGNAGMVRVQSDGGLEVAADSGGSYVGFAGTDGDRRLSGVAAGIDANDAVNVGQMQASSAQTLAVSMSYTDNRFAGIVTEFDRVWTRIAENNRQLRSEINGAAAAGAALAGLPQATVPGKGMIAFGIGGKGDRQAFAFGIGKSFAGPNAPVLRAGAAIDASTGSFTYNAAVGLHF